MVERLPLETGSVNSESQKRAKIACFQCGHIAIAIAAGPVSSLAGLTNSFLELVCRQQAKERVTRCD
jgi:tRNA threonylcarbamoyladenosine modification (KEOPS) complex  Pcc1 subunit